MEKSFARRPLGYHPRFDRISPNIFKRTFDFNRAFRRYKTLSFSKPYPSPRHPFGGGDFNAKKSVAGNKAPFLPSKRIFVFRHSSHRVYRLFIPIFRKGIFRWKIFTNRLFGNLGFAFFFLFNNLQKRAQTPFSIFNKNGKIRPFQGACNGDYAGLCHSPGFKSKR